MKKSTITFHDDCSKVLPYLVRMREESFPFVRTDRASRALHNGLFGWGSKRAIADLNWDWSIRFKAHHSVPGGLPPGFSPGNLDRRRKLEVSLMVRDSDIAMLKLMLDDLDFTVHPEPFWEQKQLRRRTDARPTDWVFPKMTLPDIIW